MAQENNSEKQFMSSAEIRQTFLDFFKSKGHHIVPSAPIVIKNDPTLLFTNAGMNQFKDYFLGNTVPQYKRVADTQKCLRVSGKHNDLEEVGVDTYHHTMFEMLGNWSFGDYFKKEAIAWSWELLTEVFKMDKSRLYVTVFGGDEKENLPKDEEAYNEWKKWISEERILNGSKKDNFWEMGDTGPCGPCTEIHYDSRTEEERKQLDGKTLINADHPQVIEIWNNVFIEFNRLKNGALEPLPARHVDTGLGFERLVRVLQNKHSNYDTDVFTGTIEAIEKIVNKQYTYSDSKQDVAFRVIADHIRAIAFAIADGQLPSNTGAGYVIRRILRRAVRYYYSYLDYKQPLLFQLMPLLAKQFENVFPELQKQIDFVGKVVKEEEEAFLKTLGVGLHKLDMIMQLKRIQANERLKNEGYGSITSPLIETNPIPIDYLKKVYDEELIVDGKSAFDLSDTYGFPIDLTRLIAFENGFKTDEIAFEKELQQQKQRSKAATAIDTEDWVVLDEHAANAFIGYDSLEAKTNIARYRKVKAKGKEAFQLVLNNTPFYAESGGQVGDTGKLLFGNEEIIITDTKKENNLNISFAEKLPEDINTEVFAKVNRDIRKRTEAHHSATHLLHAALRKILGTHVQQKGSLVNAEHLRFDFSHFAKLTDEEIEKIEALVNEKIRENINVVIKEMSKDEALTLGAMALFGEKYGDIVRVVIIDPTFSVELCGGTHVIATGELGLFKIKNETAIAAGVRRIEAVAGKTAEDFINEQLHQLQIVKDALKNPKDVQKALESLVVDNSELKKKLESAEAKQLNILKEQLLQKVQTINSVSFIGEIVELPEADALKKLCFDLKNNLSNYVIVLAANISGKANIAVAIDDALIALKNLDASKIIKEQIAPLIKGGGGGQRNLATAGGQDASNLQLVIEKVKSLL